MQLKIQLQTLKKGSLSMSDYFVKMENIVDQCMTVSFLVSEEDLIHSILAGLGPANQLSLKDVQVLLLNQESRLEQLNIAMKLQYASTNFVNKNNGNRDRVRANFNTREGHGWIQNNFRSSSIGHSARNYKLIC